MSHLNARKTFVTPWQFSFEMSASSTSKSWTVVCISDTHQQHRQLTDRLQTTHHGDILIHAGDITNFGRGAKPFEDFDQWLAELPFAHKLIIGGNHECVSAPSLQHGRFLRSEQVVIDGRLRVYGASWRPVGDSSWSDVPADSHIVITHNPPFVKGRSHVDLEARLRSRLEKVKPLLSVFGHVHVDYGVYPQTNGTIFANAASSPLSNSQPLNDPLRFKISIDGNGLASIEPVPLSDDNKLPE